MGTSAPGTLDCGYGNGSNCSADVNADGNISSLGCATALDCADLYVTLPIIYSIICAIGLTGNSAVIYVVLKGPKMKTVTNVFILNLAIADALFTLVLPINIANHLLLDWPFGEVVCKLIVSIDQFNMFTSIFFLTVMSVDRYLVVVATVQSHDLSRRTRKAAKLVSGCVWLLVTVIVAPFAVFATTYTDNQRRTSCVLDFPPLWMKASRVCALVLGFVAPVSSICALYCAMLRRLRGVRLGSHAQALDKAKRRVTVMVFVVIAVCLLCWTPYHVATVVALTAEVTETPFVIGLSYFITSLSYANSCLNPFLYAFLDDSFRKSFKKMSECSEAS